MVVVPGLRQLSIPDEVTVATEVLEEDQLSAPHAKGPLKSLMPGCSANFLQGGVVPLNNDVRIRLGTGTSLNRQQKQAADGEQQSY